MRRLAGYLLLSNSSAHASETLDSNAPSGRAQRTSTDSLLFRRATTKLDDAYEKYAAPYGRENKSRQARPSGPGQDGGPNPGLARDARKLIGGSRGEITSGEHQYQNTTPSLWNTRAGVSEELRRRTGCRRVRRSIIGLLRVGCLPATGTGVSSGAIERHTADPVSQRRHAELDASRACAWTGG
jgi:hypothetical protein